MNIVVAALYKFAPLKNLAQVQKDLKSACTKHGIKGTLLIADEGINGTIAGTREGIDGIASFIRAIDGLSDLEYKESFAETMPFYRMKVRIKKEIVTIGRTDVSPTKTVGTYVSPEEWNSIISDPETIVLDTRNDYEIDIGTFKNAVNPHTKSFVEFPDYVQKNLDPKKHKKVAMFCTGGIRCEKASSYMKQAGFENVYHLKGGILKYLEDMPKDKSLWDGDCFVFDQRVAVGHGLSLSDYILCPSCRHPVSAKDRTHNRYVEGVACPHCFDTLTPERRARSAERHKQMQLAAERGTAHIGAQYEGLEQ
jgi:UPF0176 protein